jgi:hypothetical protein
MSDPSFYKNVNGRLFINTQLYGMIPVKDYLAFLQIHQMTSKNHVRFTEFDDTEVNTDITLLGNECTDLQKEDVIRVCISYVNKFQMNSYYIPIGTKYHTHHAYILENLSRKFPSIQWSIMAKNNTQFMCKGVRV